MMRNDINFTIVEMVKTNHSLEKGDQSKSNGMSLSQNFSLYENGSSSILTNLSSNLVSFILIIIKIYILNNFLLSKDRFKWFGGV